jgi:hypothetical protein
MLGNYLLMAWRQLRRNRLYSLINITGLAVGMAVAMLIGLWIRDETTFNEWHSRYASLARILSIFRVNSEATVASVASEQRTREIGIRKVLGASVLQLWGLLSWEFVVLVLVALAFAAPIAWFYSQEWLRGFDYRANFSVWIFVVAGIGAIALALIVVSLQSVRAALANPVKSLRAD